MKTILRRAGLALAAAGALGLVTTATAQTPAIGSAVEVGPTRHADAGRKQESRMLTADRALEIQVELALLADPVSAPYRLRARVSGGGLVVSGFVSSADVKANVLKIASAASYRGVIDDLRLHPLVKPVSADVSVPRMVNDIRAALENSFPECVRQPPVNMREDRVIVVWGGAVSSLETKLTISRCIREVSGCKAIVNDVKVAVPLALLPNVPTIAEPAKKVDLLPMPEGPLVQVAASTPSENEAGPSPIPPQKATASAGMPLTVPSSLRKAVAAACGGAARKINMVATSPKALQMSIEVSSRASGEKLWKKIFELPELEAYKVDLEIKVAR